MNELYEAAVNESERFVMDVLGANTCNLVDRFRDLKILTDRLETDARFGVRAFDVEGAEFTQVYFVDNDNAFYSIIVGRYEENAS